MGLDRRTKNNNKPLSSAKSFILFSPAAPICIKVIKDVANTGLMINLLR